MKRTRKLSHYDRRGRPRMVDVTDKQAPQIVAEFDLDGFVSATRRVGDVLYAAGSFPVGYQLPEDEPDAGTDITPEHACLDALLAGACRGTG